MTRQGYAPQVQSVPTHEVVRQQGTPGCIGPVIWHGRHPILSPSASRLVQAVTSGVQQASPHGDTPNWSTLVQ